MARIPEEVSELQAVIERIERSRKSLEARAGQLRQTFDVPARVRHSVRRKPLAWFGGSLGAGLIASRLLRRKPKPKEVRKRGLMALLLTTSMTLLKPTIKKLILAEIGRRLTPSPASSQGRKETHLPLSNTNPR